MTLIVDSQEPAPAVSRRRSLALVPIAVVLLVFATTLEPVQHTTRTLLGLAGLAPLAVTLSGNVADEDEAPIAHAFVWVGQDGGLASTYTDGNGNYRLAFSVNTRMPTAVSIGAVGYEANLRQLRIASTDPERFVRLHREARIDAGAAAHLSVTPEDGLCYPVKVEGREPNQSWPCRFLHVIIAKTGVLGVTVVADDPGDRFGLTFPVGSEPTLVFETPCCAESDAARLPEGVEALVQIVALDLGTSNRGGAHGFTVRTTFDLP